MIKKTTIIISFLILPFFSHAYTENFDTGYSVGELGGQNSWSGGTGGTIINSNNQSSPNSVNLPFSGSWTSYTKITASTTSSGTFNFAIKNLGSGNANLRVDYTANGTNKIPILFFDDGTSFSLRNNSNVPVITGLSNNTWHSVDVTYNASSYTVTIDRTTSYTQSALAGITYLDKVQITKNAGTSGTFILDSFGSATPDGFNTNTHIINFTPENGTTTATTTINFAGHAYINENDIGLTTGIFMNYRNINQNTVLGILNPFEDQEFSIFYGYATTSGDVYFSTTTVLKQGNYRVEFTIANTILGIPNPIGEAYDVQNHQFIVGSSTFIGNISQNSFQALSDIFASSTATSTSNLAKSCYPFSGQFDTINCLAFLFIPDSNLIYSNINNFAETVKYHFPMGYFSDFKDIISTTTETGLPILEVTVPAGIPGAGAHMKLDPTHSLDYILNATTTFYSSEMASTSGETFYEYTSFYWNYLCYFLGVLYIIKRLIGGHLININKNVN